MFERKKNELRALEICIQRLLEKLYHTTASF